MKTKEQINDLAYDHIKNLPGDCSKYDAERAYIRGYKAAIRESIMDSLKKEWKKTGYYSIRRRHIRYYIFMCKMKY